MKHVAIIDYGSGNLHSMLKATEHAARNTGHTVSLTSNASEVAEASHIILPGVGAFADCMSGLQAINGLIDALTTRVIEQKTPFLGVCVGMQLLAKIGHEHGEHHGLGWLDAEITPISPQDPQLKIPHMGWNNLNLHTRHSLFDNVTSGDHVYFVHSYHMECKDPANILATIEYDHIITAAVGKDNIVGTQFHPEKSQKTGLRIIENFLSM